ncbi:hypothetical protein EJ03DRAFT_373397 [Teratosphaeria nubilosa]|uniref:Uncharacterized protein n=1 Tax=Teratosphaeria nubilosa TaxID=161662 RepID=A0A6G1LDX0_9PEZI|nr:hypothetical protein EJ03DRAFT_373397 [Teratosphaeria nubilosa]
MPLRTPYHGRRKANLTDEDAIHAAALRAQRDECDSPHGSGVEKLSDDAIDSDAQETLVKGKKRKSDKRNVDGAAEDELDLKHEDSLYEIGTPARKRRRSSDIDPVASTAISLPIRLKADQQPIIVRTEEHSSDVEAPDQPKHIKSESTRGSPALPLKLKGMPDDQELALPIPMPSILNLGNDEAERLGSSPPLASPNPPSLPSSSPEYVVPESIVQDESCRGRLRCDAWPDERQGKIARGL